MPAGRPLELTPAIIAEVAKLLPRALYLETVSAQLGIHRDTFNEWARLGAREHRRRELGKEHDPKRDLHCEFSVTIKKALGRAESDYLAEIQAAGTEVWQAVAWILERRFPERWASNRGELRELAKQIAALGKQGVAGGVPPTTPKKAKKARGAA
jgi:transposase